MFNKLLLVSLLVAGFSAQAILPLQSKDQRSNDQRSKKEASYEDFSFYMDLRYQIGTEWGKKPVSNEQLAKESEAFQRAAKATARVGGGTSFYLGVFNGKHIMATNHHVMPGASNCGGRSVSFPLMGITLRCQEFIGHWTAIDLALFVLSTPTPTEAAELAKVGRNFSFSRDIMKGDELMTIGFGIADNPNRALVGNQDSDCRVFSKDAEYQFMADPDELNPADYRAWSFANGCDVSHGDSGSAMVDRKTGDVLGIIWTGRIPKEQKVQTAEFLKDIYDTNSNEVWKHLSYSVPAKKMGEVLADVVSSPDTSAEAAKTISAILGR